MNKIEIEQLFSLRFLSDLKPGKKEDLVFFNVRGSDVEKDEYTVSLYAHEEGKTTSLVKEDYGGLYLPEEESVLCLGKPEKDKKESHFYRVSLVSGEKKDAFTLPFVPNDIKLVKKGLYLLSAQVDLNDINAYKRGPKEEGKDCIVLTESPFYFNGQGFIDRKRKGLFLYQERGGVLTYLNVGAVRLAAYDVNEKGIYFAADKGKAKENFIHDLYYYDFAKKKAEKLLSTGLNIYDLRVWGTKVLLLGSAMEDYGVNENPKFYTYDPKAKKITLLAENDDGFGSSVLSDVHLGGGKCWLEDGGDIYYLTTERNASVIRKLDPFGRITTFFKEEGAIVDFLMQGGNLVLLGDYGMRPSELYRVNKGELTKITALNERALKGRYIAKPKKINFNSCGYDIDGWVLAPFEYDAKKKYPAILEIHGGPKCVYGETFIHEMQLLASQGYFVLFANPFGGDGRGNRFADLRGKYGSIDFNNLMDFVDEVLKRYPSIDRSRIGVTGGSYGGFMTNWIVTHSRRFAAAATQRSISNWLSMCGTSDIGYAFAEDQCGGKLYQEDEAEILWEHSPLKFAKALKTPLLVLHSDCDYRCPLEQGYQMYAAAVEKGVPAKMVIFKGENHDLSRAGKPSLRKRRLEEITAWFEKYLRKGK